MATDMYASVEAHTDGNDPISYSGHLFLCRPFANETAANENPSPAFSISDFPFPFEDHDDFIFTDLLFEHQPLADQEAKGHEVSDQIQVSEKIGEMDLHVTENHSSHEQQQQKKKEAPRKRPSKRDRHTKIKTAQGLRDRRVRLSIEVAGSFFRLQDMLRFDKASKTIDWLLNQAKDEINARLEREKSDNNILISSSTGVQSMSSMSECEELGLDEVTGSATNHKQNKAKSSVKARRIKRSRKILLKPRPKEVRAKARERARERTKEKIMRSRKLIMEESRDSTEATNYRTHVVGEESHTTCQSNTNRSLDEVAKDQERSFRSKDHSGASNEQSSLTHQFAVQQYLNNPWQTYNVHTLQY